jgi:peptide deformylase
VTEDEDIQDLIMDLFDTLRANQGVGLAAPQLGISKRVAVAQYGFTYLVMVNPRILAMDGFEEKEEGCLSVPVARVMVGRPQRITLENRYVAVPQRLDGWLARVAQHEMDHLDGILITDYLNPLRNLGEHAIMGA